MTANANQVLRPRGPQIERLAGNRAKVVIEPLERGYGHTLGNALRRVLLSSIPGFAITERSEEHTPELQSLMLISYAVFCLKKTQMNKQNSHCKSTRI